MLLAEDNRDWINTFESMAEELGFNLVLSVETLEEAMAAIVLAEKLMIDLIILGGNLGGKFKEGNTDARALLNKLAELGYRIPTIGFTGEYINRYVPEGEKKVDLELSKMGDWNRLKDVIDSLMLGKKDQEI